MARIPKLKYNQLIEVTCSDITEDSSWLSEEKVRNKKLLIVKTVGYYLCHNKEKIIISSMIDVKEKPEDRERSSTVIPLGMVTKIGKLK